MKHALLALGIAAAAVLGGCTSADQPRLTVFAAASLKTALERLADEYGAAHLVVSTASSSTLRTQIEQGAPADVFLSADTANPQALADGGHADGQPVAFAANKLTIVVPEGNPGGVASPADLAREDVTIIAAADEVPITKYADQAVDQLAALPGYPFEFAAAYRANVASREDNVGAVTSKIDLGEGDAAIVYVTDATAVGLETIDIPPEANVDGTYAGIVTGTSKLKTQAHAFLDWLRQPSAQRILGELGFQPAP